MSLFPPSGRRLACETFLRILRNDPVLRSRVKTIKTWSGNTQDAEEIASGMCPALRLTTTGNSSDTAGWSDNGHHDATITVRYEMYVMGTDEGDLWDFDEAIVRAVFPADDDQREHVNQLLWDAGITAPTFESYGVAVKQDAGGMYLQGVGQMTLMYTLAT